MFFCLKIKVNTHKPITSRKAHFPGKITFCVYLAGFACVLPREALASLRPSARNEHSEPSKFLSRALRNFTKLTPTYQS